MVMDLGFRFLFFSELGLHFRVLQSDNNVTTLILFYYYISLF